MFVANKGVDDVTNKDITHKLVEVALYYAKELI